MCGVHFPDTPLIRLITLLKLSYLHVTPGGRSKDNSSRTNPACHVCGCGMIILRSGVKRGQVIGTVRIYPNVGISVNPNEVGPVAHIRTPLAQLRLHSRKFPHLGKFWLCQHGDVKSRTCMSTSLDLTQSSPNHTLHAVFVCTGRFILGSTTWHPMQLTFTSYEPN